MNKFAVFVLGPAGTGKTTFCKTMIEKMHNDKKSVSYMNLDPAVENCSINNAVDIRSVYPLEKIMNQERLGPNGGLMKCLELLTNDSEWWSDSIGEYNNEFIYVDCPGQIEVYTCSSFMSDILQRFKNENYSICVAFLIDAQFMQSSSKFISGVLTSLSAMIQLEVPQINILSKMDQYRSKDVNRIKTNEDLYDEVDQFDDLSRFFYPDLTLLQSSTNPELDEKIIELLDSYNLVSYVPLDITDETSVRTVIESINNVLQNDDAEIRCISVVD